jgi:hypothetical protein
MTGANRDVFINCPFDQAYQPKLHAIVFTVFRSGFRARCALEADNAASNRFAKICSIIEECRYGVHDLSRTEVDGEPPLPRFNMPLELGVFLGFCIAGNKLQRQKRCIVFDKERYRYQRFISDISGQDIHSHDGDERRLIIELASWLRVQSRDPKVPGGHVIARQFEEFAGRLPEVLDDRGLTKEELTFSDYTSIVASYLGMVERR